MIAPGRAHGKGLILAGHAKKAGKNGRSAITNSLKISQ